MVRFAFGIRRYRLPARRQTSALDTGMLDYIPLVTAFACRRAILSMSKASAHIHDAARTVQL